MRRRLPQRLIACILIALFAVVGATAQAAQPETAPAGSAAVSQWLAANVPTLMTEARLPGFTIAVVQNGETIYAEGFGARDPAKNLPATPDTLFGVGSITKSFVAIGILQLADQGKLRFDDPVRKHIPFELGTADDPIRIHHLLTHSLGVPSLATSTVAINRGLGFDTGIPLASAADFYRFVNGAQDEIVSRPGERFFYHNAAWRMLAHIIQEASGLPFHIYIKRHVMQPLGMNRSTLDVAAFEADPNHIVPQLRQADGGTRPSTFPYPNPDDNPDFSFIAGAGGVTSSVREMTAYLNANIELGRHASGQLASEELFGKMQQLHMNREDGYYGPSGYGYGLSVVPDFFGTKMLNHGGSVLVSTAYMAFIPERKLGVIMMGNSSGMGYATIAESVFALLLGRDPDELPANRAKARMARLTGDYEIYRGIEQISVVNSRGMLYLESTSRTSGQATRTPLVPDDLNLESTRFSIIRNGLKSPVEFVAHDDGRVDLYYGRYCFHKRGATADD